MRFGFAARPWKLDNAERCLYIFFFFKQYDIDRISKLHISLRLLLTFFLEYHVISKYVPLCSRLLIMMREVVGLLSVRKV